MPCAVLVAVVVTVVLTEELTDELIDEVTVDERLDVGVVDRTGVVTELVAVDVSDVVADDGWVLSVEVADDVAVVVTDV